MTSSLLVVDVLLISSFDKGWAWCGTPSNLMDCKLKILITLPNPNSEVYQFWYVFIQIVSSHFISLPVLVKVLHQCFSVLFCICESLYRHIVEGEAPSFDVMPEHSEWVSSNAYHFHVGYPSSDCTRGPLLLIFLSAIALVLDLLIVTLFAFRNHWLRGHPFDAEE